jgi:hypothetical protein
MRHGCRNVYKALDSLEPLALVNQRVVVLRVLSDKAGPQLGCTGPDRHTAQAVSDCTGLNVPIGGGAGGRQPVTQQQAAQL